MNSISKKNRVLVIAHSCLRSVNRRVYRLLIDDNTSLHLVVPLHSSIPGSPDPIDQEPFPVSFLTSHGPHSRLIRVLGLKELIREFQPTHIISETDIASLLTSDILGAVNRSTHVWLVSIENMQRRFIAEAWKALFERDLRIAVGGVIAQWFAWRNVHRINHIFSISKAGTQAVQALGYHGQVTQIPLGFDPLLFNIQSPDSIQTTRNRLGLTKTTIAYFGRLVPEKGVENLIQALGKLQHLEWQFLIDSFSDYRSPYEQQIDQLLDEYGIKIRTVFFEAHHDEMPTYMNAADIVVLASVSTKRWVEQYGKVIPEAMACGKVVVGSSSGTIPELIGDAGFIVSEGDVNQLATMLEKLLNTPAKELDRVREKAYERAQTSLSIRQQADVWIKLLQR